MTIEEIKELLQIFNESGVAELELQRGENRLRLRRAEPEPEHIAAPPARVATSQPPPNTSAASPALPKATEAESENTLVKSPIVGTYYESPAPGAPEFVRVGDAV